MKHLIFIGTVLAWLVTTDGAAQSAPQPIFSSLGPPSAPTLDLPQGVAARQVVGMRLDRLFDSGAGSVLLNVDGQDLVALFDRIDGNVLGHRSWVGTLEGIDYSSVVISERSGVVSGFIDAVAAKYQISTVNPGVYTVDTVVAVKTGEGTDDAITPPPDASDAPGQRASTGSDTAAFIDVLLLWTPAARSTGTTAAMQALAAQIISQSNQAYANSGIATRLRLAGAIEFPYAEAALMSTDLTNLRTNAGVGAARDSVGADLVQLLVRSSDAPCGIGYLLNDNAAYGYSVADIVCLGQYTPTHEMGHNQGSHHAPEDGATGGYYAYSYGYKDQAHGFRTIMAYDCPSISCPRTLNLSNPAVNHSSGFPTGTGTQNNATSINNTAFTVANFRQATATVTPPGAPTGLTSQVNGLSATLSWNPVTADLIWGASPATGYVLQVGSAPGVYNLLTLPVGNTTSVSGSAWPATYYWRVFGINSAGNGAPSAEAQFTLGGCAPPSAPQNFTHTVGAGRVVTLSWAAPATGAAPFSYIIDAGSAPGLTNILSAPVGGATSISVAAPPGTYYVRIRAANACASTSPVSNERTIVVP